MDTNEFFYDKHVERMENWKDINEEEEWASKVGLATLFLLNWETSMSNIMLEFLNTFNIKGTNIYFGYQDKVYVISKHLTINVFGVCAKGCIQDPQGQVSNSLALQTLESYKIIITNSIISHWNVKSSGLPYFVRYPTIISMNY